MTMFFLDMKTLKAVSLVNRDLNHEASKILFHAVRIDPRRSGPAKADACTFLSHASNFILRKDRSPVILRLSMYVRDLGEDQNAEEAVGRLYKALMSVNKLVDLSVEGGYDERQVRMVLKAMSATSFAPGLQKLRLGRIPITLDIGDLFQSFWASHQALTTVRSQRPLPVPRHPLPALACVHISGRRQSAIIRGHPVTDICMGGMFHQEPIFDLRHIMLDAAQSTRDILRLSLFVVRDAHHIPFPLDPFVFTGVIAALPHLRYLALMETTRDYHPSVSIRLNAIASLEYLEELEWLGHVPLSVRDAFFRACSHPCNSLQRVVFEHGTLEENKRTLEYEREGVDAPWVQIPSRNYTMTI